MPHIEQHPLEDDHSKSSYDTPGALDSYGHPVTNSHTPQSNNFYSSESGTISNEYPGEFKNEDTYQTIDYFNQLNDIHDFHRKRRQETKVGETIEEKIGEEIRYPNHRYD